MFTLLDSYTSVLSNFTVKLLKSQIVKHTVLKYSGHAVWFGPVLGQHLWQLSTLAWKHKNVNATYLLFIFEGIKIG